jgi:hypothetical protein
MTCEQVAKKLMETPDAEFVPCIHRVTHLDILTYDYGIDAVGDKVLMEIKLPNTGRIMGNGAIEVVTAARARSAALCG